MIIVMVFGHGSSHDCLIVWKQRRGGKRGKVRPWSPRGAGAVHGIEMSNDRQSHKAKRVFPSDSEKWKEKQLGSRTIYTTNEADGAMPRRLKRSPCLQIDGILSKVFFES